MSLFKQINMKNFLNKELFLVVFCVLVLLSACGKDNTITPDPALKPKTKTELITVKLWKIGKNEVKSSGGAWETGTIKDCDTDDTFLFKVNFTVEEAFGAKCPGTMLVTPWAFLETETKLKWGNFTYGIVTLDETVLVLDVSANQRVTFVH